MSDLVEYVDRNGDRWAFMAGDHTWLESPAHGGRRCAVWYVLREYGPLVPAGFLADMEGATQDLGEAAEEIERLRAEVASLRQQLDEARDLLEASRNLHANAEHQLAEVRGDEQRRERLAEEWRADMELYRTVKGDRDRLSGELEAAHHEIGARDWLIAQLEADRDRLPDVYPGSREVAGFTEWSRIVEPKPELTAAEHDWQSPRGKKQRRCAKCERWETLWSKQWPCNVPSPR